MHRLDSLLLEVWREACRHIEVDQSLARIAALLADHLPLRGLALYIVDTAAERVDRLGAVLVGVPGASPPAPILDKADVRRLARWCKTEEAVHAGAGAAPGPLPWELVSGLGGDALAIPLCSEHGARGMLVLGAREGAEFAEKEALLAGLLREPLAVALENDGRLRELIALREAAEADKRKLLHRLGRERLTDEVVGAEGGLRAVMERVALVARSEAPVLIFGETGSGKEVVARAIHEGSPRAAGPFIRVNCGAIPSELIDSELFGHERGSFTGAVAERKGWFERADGGTLFLDEIGELPPAAQVRLLRVLQDSSFERVGGERVLHVNVRIVAATLRDLARMVQEHRFREDLWYRIAVFPIVLPPLRERKQDIPALADHFAERAARRFGLRLQLPGPEDIGLLMEYGWPGNVRELASVLDRAAILGDGERLEVGKALGFGPPASARQEPGQGARRADAALATLDEAMRRHIERALAMARGKIEGPGGAASLLNINPHTLRARMRKLGIAWKFFREQPPLGARDSFPGK